MVRWITGLSLPQQYICVDRETFAGSFRVIASASGLPSVDVTESHLFLGYKPRIVGLPVAENISPYPNHLDLEFRVPSGSEKPIAKLRLETTGFTDFSSMRLQLFTGLHGRHRFLSQLHQWINKGRFSLKPSRAGNVGLDGNLHDQVRIAYAVPRSIAVITLRRGDVMNAFPTDLHGPAGEGYYAGALRIGGLATTQVEAADLIALSEVDCSRYREVYALGGNHMKPMSPSGNFEVMGKTEHGLPLLAGTLRYRELKLLRSIDIGIHRIHTYKVVADTCVRDGVSLAHIHQYAAQWRRRSGLLTEFLLR